MVRLVTGWLLVVMLATGCSCRDKAPKPAFAGVFPVNFVVRNDAGTMLGIAVPTKNEDEIRILDLRAGCGLAGYDQGSTALVWKEPDCRGVPFVAISGKAFHDCLWLPDGGLAKASGAIPVRIQAKSIRGAWGEQCINLAPGQPAEVLPIEAVNVSPEVERATRDFSFEVETPFWKETEPVK